MHITFFFEPTRILDTLSTTKNLNLNNGRDDEIHARTLIAMSGFITKPLSHISNICIVKLVWQDALKKNIIFRIYKATDKPTPN